VGVADRVHWGRGGTLELGPAVDETTPELIVRQQRQRVVSQRMEADRHPGLAERADGVAPDPALRWVRPDSLP
jgi:hypothetical protein